VSLNVITNSLRYNATQKYLVIDKETENLNLHTGNRPWQLGAMVATRDEVISTHDLWIKWPDLKLSEGAALKTHYDPVRMEKEGRDPKEVLEFFEKYLFDKSYRIVFFNGFNFDSYIISTWRKALGLQPDYSFIDRCIDVRAFIVADKLQVSLNDGDNLLFWQYRMLGVRQRGLKSNLTLACKENGIKVDETLTHQGLYDVELTYLLFKEMVLKKFNIK
jgi:hypothetical protein